MSYLVLARKYRPQTFEQVIGQEHITQTLKNALLNKKLGHAYLFSGPRGVGKTTTARIFAKALNCTGAKGPEPCNKCASCEEISGGNALDVIEIDGASNRQIDDIRALRENVKFAPSYSKYKVYIIDEVHMLTAEAFNALLKTLEEPPAHIVFIFATTQPYKVPTTILSRCQRFNFRQITIEETVGALKNIAKPEKIEINDDALYLVAKSASGSLRDALTILDEVISLNPEKTTYEDVTTILGVIDYRILIEFAEVIAGKDIKAGLVKIDKIINSGYDLSQFIKDLREHFRNLLMAKTADNVSSLVTLASGDLEEVKNQAGKFTEGELLRTIDVLTNLDERIKFTDQKRLILEVGMVKLCSSFVSLDELLHDIELLEKKLGLPDKNIPGVKIERAVYPKPPAVETVKPVIDYSVQTQRSVHTVVGDDLAELKNKWSEIIKLVTTEKGSLMVFLNKCQPAEIVNGTVTLAFNKDDKFAMGSVQRNENKELLTRCMEEVTHKKYKIICQSVDNILPNDSPEPPKETVPDKGNRDFQPKHEEPKQEAVAQVKTKGVTYTPKEIVRQEPIIEKAIDIFNGEIADTE
ncbi:MAG: DNA polymerase III subunit gamma/tau [bacterium]